MVLSVAINYYFCFFTHLSKAVEGSQFQNELGWSAMIIFCRTLRLFVATENTRPDGHLLLFVSCLAGNMCLMDGRYHFYNHRLFPALPDNVFMQNSSSARLMVITMIRHTIIRHMCSPYCQLNLIRTIEFPGSAEHMTGDSRLMGILHLTFIHLS